MILTETQRQVILNECAAGSDGEVTRRERRRGLIADLPPTTRRDLFNAEAHFRYELHRAALAVLDELLAPLPESEFGDAEKVWAMERRRLPSLLLMVRCPAGHRLGSVWRTPSDGPLYVGLGRVFDHDTHQVTLHPETGRDVFPDLLELLPDDPRHALWGSCLDGHARIKDREGVRTAVSDRLRGRPGQRDFHLPVDGVSYPSSSTVTT